MAKKKESQKVSHSELFNSRTTNIVTVGTTKATSSRLEADFHDIPYAGLLAAARRFTYGRKRHGRFNWKQGDNIFAEERLKHLVNHVMLFAEFRHQSDLDALICNAMMIAWFMDNNLLSTTPMIDFMFQGKEDVDKVDKKGN